MRGLFEISGSYDLCILNYTVNGNVEIVVLLAHCWVIELVKVERRL